MLDVDALRAKANSPLAEVWLHGKLLYALMLEQAHAAAAGGIAGGGWITSVRARGGASGVCSKPSWHR